MHKLVRIPTPRVGHLRLSVTHLPHLGDVDAGRDNLACGPSTSQAVAGNSRHVGRSERPTGIGNSQIGSCRACEATQAILLDEEGTGIYRAQEELSPELRLYWRQSSGSYAKWQTQLTLAT